MLLLSYLAFVIATLPAAFVWKHIQQYVPVQQLPVRIEAVAGTLWDGQVLLRTEGLPVLVDWSLQPAGIFTGVVPADIRIQSTAGELKGQVEVAADMLAVQNLKGVLRLDPLNPALSRQRITLAGDVAVRNVQFRLHNGRLSQAEADVAWSGGNISYPAGRQQHQRNLPLFNARVTTSDGSTRLSVRDGNASFDVISGSIDSAGVAMLEVTRRVLDLASEPWPSNSTEKDVVFKVKRKLYTGPAQG